MPLDAEEWISVLALTCRPLYPEALLISSPARSSGALAFHRCKLRPSNNVEFRFLDDAGHGRWSTTRKTVDIRGFYGVAQAFCSGPSVSRKIVDLMPLPCKQLQSSHLLSSPEDRCAASTWIRTYVLIILS